jgi:N-acetyl-alpha-D-glucosaminyl L-malate synthase BshA
VAADVAAGLASRGHRVHLLSDRAPFRLEDVEVPVKLHTVSVPSAPALACPPLTLALASKLSEVARSARLDVLHVHYAVPNAVAAQLARSILGASAPPMVVTLHGTDVSPLGADPALRPVVRSALLDAAGITAPSRHLARLAGDQLGLARDVEVIPNFVDPARFEGRSPRRGSAPFTVVHVSNFRPVKRVGDAVAAFARVVTEVEARLLLVGDGPERPAVEAQVRALGLSDHVRFLGVRHDVARWLRRADAALVPSAAESFGLSALEALAAGLPVVATRVGGLADVVRDGETGLLAEVGDVEGLARQLRRLAENPDLRSRLGAAGRADAQARFHPELALDRYERALSRAAGRPVE